MSLKIADEELKHGRSGTMLRFTVHIVPLEGHGMWTKGFLAFRNEKGAIQVKPPVTYLVLYGKRIKYYGTGLLPETLKTLEGYVEATWGAQIVGDPDWNESRKVTKVKQKVEEGWGGVSSETGNIG